MSKSDFNFPKANGFVVLLVCSLFGARTSSRRFKKISMTDSRIPGRVENSL